MNVPPDYRLESLGRGVYLFRWQRGYYVSPFVVGRTGVTAFDPIDDRAARVYRQAIASVTDKPLRRLVYSHDHRDHICGGAVLCGATADCEVYAHERT
ncbi:MAG: MBL fold metallo-hydrolase, partial [Gammaproteobacteria bacterium]|nr:MBL fold metallo-hydrolase [Gammaproteobacteria bacterium]